MGMGLFPRNGELFIDQLIKSGKLDAPVFSFWISSDKNNAELTLGGIDLAKNATAIQWIPLIVRKEKPYWITSFGNISIIAGANITKVSVNASSQSVFDSGTSFSYLPKGLAKELNTKLGAKLHDSGSSDVYSFNCSLSYPDIEVVFGGKKFIITSDEYISVYYGTPHNLCISSFFGQELGDVNLQFLIGNAILRRWQVSYNLGIAV